MKRLQWLRRGGLVLSACLSAFGVLVAGSANAGTYYEEQGQLVRASRSVKALGPDLFGDKVNHYNGALEFVQADVSLPGNSELAVSAGRRFNANLTPGFMNGLFGRWDLEIPRIQGVFANSSGFVNGWGAADRCSRFSAPPTVTGAMAEGAWKAKEYWHGNMLYIPGGGEKEILLRLPGGWTGPTDDQNYPLLTKDNWALRCITLATGGGDGEGFMALSPSGVRYQFDWMASRQANTLARSAPYGNTLKPGRQPPSKTGPTPTASVLYYLKRTEVWILPTQITDRFGNWVRFSYDPVDRMRVLSIESSDGRKLSFTYQESPRRIKTITTNAGANGSRTWTYNYAADGDLSSVVLPDQSRWGFDIEPAFMTSEDMYFSTPATCLGNGVVNKYRHAAVMTHPSGAQGRFEVEPLEHARASNDAACIPLTDDLSVPLAPAYYVMQSVQKKTLSGPGMPTQTWNYSYSPSTGEGSYPGCTYCPSTKWTQIQEPNGRSTRMTHGMQVGVNEGLLLKTEDFDAQGSLLRTVSQSYRAYDAGPYPQKVGSSIINFGDGYLHGRLQPLQQRVITQQGQNFSWTASSGGAGIDSWGRVIQVTKSGPGGSRIETMVYKDIPNLWVRNLTESVTVNGFAASVYNDYDTLGRKTADKAFGMPQFTYGYNGDGTLAWKQDGRNNRTRYDNYKLGLPQSVSYADGSAESVVVDGLGQISSHTSAASYTTGYDYDAMGRLKLITPPSGFTSTSLVFEPVSSDEYGVAAGHWRQTVTKGNAKTITVLDALWRPVMTRTFDSSQEASTRKVVVKGYDLSGQLSFESYPARDYGTVALTSPGKRMTYDALGRLTLLEQDSELGVLKTRQDYLSGFTTAITNPRDKVTTQSFWALDNPAEASLAQADMPEGVQVFISRNSLGTPTAISRGGVTRRYVYDAYQRLCKTIDPEINATVQDYDAAGNIAWRAPGQNLNSIDNCNTASAQASAKISYSYDAVNQLKVTSYGDNSPAITRSYWPDGKLKTVDSNGSSWSYTYNALRDISTETLSYGGQSYGLSWGYDPNGSLSSLTYPGGRTAVSYVPNALGEPSQVGGFASALTFHPNGTVNSYRLNNGVQHSMTPNLRGLPAVNQDTGVLNDAYTYDANGNVASITDQQGGGAFNRSMVYDDLDRLKTVSAPGVWGTASYTYDAADNLRTANVGSRNVTLNYTDGTNRLNSLTVNGSPVNYGYDAYGNIRSKGAQTYTFDLGNRLSGSSLGGAYVYDGLGRRVQVTGKDGSLRISVYSQAGQLLWSTQPVAGGTPAQPKYSCEANYVLSNTTCVGQTQSKPASTVTVCPNGETLRAGQCVTVKAAGSEAYCDTGVLKNGQCEVTQVQDYAASNRAVCRSVGYTLRTDGKCVKDVPDDYAATLKETCADGSTPAAGQCSTTKEEDAKQETGCPLGTLRAWPPNPSQQACMSNETVTARGPTPAATACQALGSPYGATLLGVWQDPGAGAAAQSQPRAIPESQWYCGFTPVQRYVCSRGTLVNSNRCRYTESSPSIKGYTCPYGGILDGTMCRRTRTDVQDAAQELYCPKGGQLDGSMCRLSATSTNPPKTRSTCDAGYTPDGSTCYKPTGSTPTTQYGCDSGWTPVNGQCTYKAPDKPATVKYVCADGSTPPTGGQCAAGVQSTAYIYLGGKAIAEVNSASGTQYVHTDALGSPVAHTGASGSLLNTTRFEPYGAVAQGAKPGPATSLMGYTGHVQDPETGLVYMQQRYYDPIAGRFLSVDPIVTDANTGKGFGLYTYVENNPYTKIDPDGRDPHQDPWKPSATACWWTAGCSYWSSSDSSSNWRATAKEDGNYVSTALEQKFDETFSGEGWIFFPGLYLVRSALGTPRFLGDYMAEPTLGGTAVLAMGIVARIGPAGGMAVSRSSLQHTFKHAKDFGVVGNASNKTLSELLSVIRAHVGASGTRAIQGTYRGTSVTHFVDPKTGLNVMQDSAGNLLSGWRLSPQQLENVLTRGSL